ncbi:MAG: hybrid sensor histidine kinase/response regulator [Brevundimonas sp.]|jgi:signal transduction histidine kinase|uniref:hybrid sensor histidine kinase/response regulator n=1 Tax=Brevundimonas TaxID=41275 RepID=UPI0022AF5B1A|nr:MULTISPECIES: hybrid sensor histidine kinase/response regulator [Brevundimonas]MCH4270104.1 hybrid sensor histidine kinase/response regulator [Brevundimonas sp.]MCZ4107862.1 hybrid sensor histidine kinase/response regulator [Brevundimonas diminuta]
MSSPEQPIHLLLVDDLEENLLALEALLKREDVVCLKARSGDEALELLLIHDVALALVDVQMPGMDGFQLAEFMRGNVNARHVPIIFVTAGSADLQRRFRGYEAGAVDFIQKPIETDILRSKANVFIDLYRQRREILAQRDELEAYANALRAADRRKNDFIAMLGHELRNPIMALRAGLQLLERQSDKNRKADIQARMEVQAHHLSRLIEDLLDVARIDQGKISLQRERVSLQSVIESAVDTSRPKIEAGAHDLTVALPSQPLWLEGDFTRLSQVVSNLLTNAAKYTPSEGQIRISADVVQDEVRIDIADNGVGVPHDMQGRIFDLFTQSKGPDDRSREGLGIGLALVKQLVEMHDGAVELASDGPGRGSCFTLRFPLAA